MRRFADMATASLALIFGGVAVASSHPAVASLEPAFNNTIVSTHPDGRQARLWFRADRTYTAEGRQGGRSSGVWTVKGAKVCLTQHSPFRSIFSFCKLVPVVAVGQHWSDVAVNGERVDNQILPGHAAAADPRKRR